MNLLTINADIIPNVRLIGHISYTKPWIHFERVINEYILYIIKSGELYIQEGKTQYSLKKGDILLLEPNVVHNGFKASCCHYYYIHFNHSDINILNTSYDEIFQEILQKRKLSLASDFLATDINDTNLYYFPKYYHIENEDEVISLLTLAYNDFHKKYEGYKKVVSLKLLELFIIICRDYASSKILNTQGSFGKSFVKARSILNYINTNYNNKITSADIEEIFESNYDYLNRIFHKATGYTINNYLNAVRINNAKVLMDTTTMKISDIAYLVGINDPYYFTKIFKKYTGMTPTQYIKKQ